MKNLIIFLSILLLISCNSYKTKNKDPITNSTLNTVKFEIQESNCKASLRGVCTINKNIAWACGSNNTFLRTTNGGENWLHGKIHAEKNLDFRDIEAFNGDTALVLSAGRPAKIFKTINGGQDWNETYHNDTEGVFFNSMAFWDEENGIAVGDPIDKSFLIITTNNGGETWNENSDINIPDAYPGEAQFAASGTCITIHGKNMAWFASGGAKIRIFKTEDKGKTWTVSGTPLKNSSSSSGIFSITFKNEKDGIAIGGDYKNPKDNSENILITNDGGKTWIQPYKSIPSEFRSCISYIPDNESSILIAMGKTGSDFSNDNGANWNLLDTTGYYSIDFDKNNPIGWAVGSEGRIAKLIGM